MRLYEAMRTSFGLEKCLVQFPFPLSTIRAPTIPGKFTGTRRTNLGGKFVVQERENAPVKQPSEQ